MTISQMIWWNVQNMDTCYKPICQIKSIHHKNLEKIWQNTRGHDEDNAKNPIQIGSSMVELWFLQVGDQKWNKNEKQQYFNRSCATPVAIL